MVPPDMPSTELPTARGDWPALHPVLGAVFRAFEEAELNWCVLRLPSDPGTPDGDVDVLISGADARRMQQILDTLGFGGRAPVWGYVSGALFLYWYRETDRWICLHVVTDLSFGPWRSLMTHAAAGCLARCKRDEMLRTLAPDDAFWLLLLHCMLDKTVIVQRHRTPLQELATSACLDGELARAAGAACPDGWDAARMVECVRLGTWNSLEQVAPLLAAGWPHKAKTRAGSMRVLRGRDAVLKLINLATSKTYRCYMWQAWRLRLQERARL